MAELLLFYSSLTSIDLVLLLGVASVLVVGPLAIPAVVSLHAEADPVAVDPAAVNPGYKKLFAKHDLLMEEIGYRPTGYFHDRNLGPNIVRLYSSLTDSGIALVAAMAAVPETGDAQREPVVFVEFMHYFVNTAGVKTNNAPISLLFEEVPGEDTERVSGATTKQLYALHMKRIAGVKLAQITRPTLDQQLYLWRYSHSRSVNHQISRGLLSKTARNNRHYATTKMAFRGIRNFLNPFADDFSILRLFAGVVGVAGPIVGYFYAVKANLFSHPFLTVDTMLIPYLVGGAILGSVFRAKLLIWTIVLLYIPTRLLGATLTFEPFVAYTLASFVATTIAKQRRAALPDFTSPGDAKKAA